MFFTSWLRRIHNSLHLAGECRPAQRQPRSTARPHVEVLEDRCVPSTAGSLDPTFGNGAGYVTTLLSNLPGEWDIAESALIQSGGRIVVVGASTSSANGSSIGLARYNADGSLDTSFGNAGKVIGPAAANINFIHGALYPTVGNANDGKIVVGGLSSGFSIARYDANGSLDISFGSNGIATANFGTTSIYDVFFEVVQPDGKIIALGQTANSMQGQMARFNANGSLDTTFGEGGMVTGPVADPSSLLIQPDGKLVMVGDAYGGSSELARYNANGTLDTSFGTGGIVTNNAMALAYAGAIYPVTGTMNDGKIIVVGESGSSVLELARYNSDGSLDNTFHDGSVLTISQIRGDLYNTQGIAVQTDGRIVVAGIGPNNMDFATARFNVDGSPDNAFGLGGVTTTSTGGGGSHAVTMDANGNIVVAGYGYVGINIQRSFAVARYLGQANSPYFVITGSASLTAGTAGTYTISVLNPNGSADTAYSGTVQITSSDPQAVLPANFTITGGTVTFSATLKTAGLQSLTATDTVTSGITGSDASIQVNPGAATQLVISGPSSVGSGSAFSITVTVLDAYGNVATGYTGTVKFTDSASGATLPANYTFTAADAGTHTFKGLKLKTKGKQTLTVEDTLDSLLIAELTISVS